LHEFLDEKIPAFIFALYDNDETYKTHQETFLREGLQRYVCTTYNFAGLPSGRLFYYPHPLKGSKEEY
jgi:hypothetical protein